MIISMTGFGSAVESSDNYRVRAEIKSVNSKFFDLNLRLPKELMEHEFALRTLLSEKLHRGKVNVNLEIEMLNEDRSLLKVNKNIVKKYLEQFTELRKELNLTQEISLQYLLSLPNSTLSEQEEDPEEWKLVEKALKKAISKITDNREEEGKALEKDLKLRGKLIRESLEKVEETAPRRISSIRNRIQANLNELQDKFSHDANRFEQEMIYYLEKLDITEEIIRLRYHLDSFNKVMNDEEENGKKLGFISQEMGREINTIGSKANDAEIQSSVIRMKDDLEKIKEQLLNVI